MTSTTLPALRPLSLGELLDQAFRLYRKDFLTYIGIISVTQIPVALLELLSILFGLGFFTNSGSQFSVFTGLSPILNLAVVLARFLLVQSIATSAITRATADRFLGRPIGLGQAFRRISSIWSRLTGALFMAGMATIGLGFWFLIPIVGWFTGLGMILFLSGVIVRLLGPIVVLEGKYTGFAVRRGWDLARRRFWWMAGFALVLFVLSEFLLIGPSTLATYLMTLVARAANSSFGNLTALRLILGSTVELLMSLLYIPLEIIAVTLVYIDLRIRTEGLDLDLLTGGESMSATELPLALTEAPPPERTRLVNSAELFKFAGLSIVPLLFYAVIFASAASLLTGMFR